MRRRRHPTGPAQTAPAGTTTEAQTSSVLFGDEVNVLTFSFLFNFCVVQIKPLGGAAESSHNDFASPIIFCFLCELLVTWVALLGRNRAAIYRGVSHFGTTNIQTATLPARFRSHV